MNISDHFIDHLLIISLWWPFCWPFICHLLTIYWEFVHFRYPRLRVKTKGKLTMLTLTAGGSSMSSSLKHVRCHPRFSTITMQQCRRCVRQRLLNFYGMNLVNGRWFMEWGWHLIICMLCPTATSTSSQILVFKVDSTLMISQWNIGNPTSFMATLWTLLWYIPSYTLVDLADSLSTGWDRASDMDKLL